jgi:nitric oxide reductase NorD protein
MNSPPPSSDAQIARVASPLDRELIEANLDRLLDPVLSSRRTAAPLAERVALLPRHEQDFLLQWATVIARTNIELAFQFVVVAPDTFGELDARAAETWIIEAMDAYDRDGLYAATQVLASRDAIAGRGADAVAVNLEHIAKVLHLIVNGLAARALRIEPAPQACTDTETLYLPERIDRADTVEGNFFLYKASAMLLWAQARYGTFNIDLETACSEFPDSQRALRLLAALETIRLEARLSRTLPGLARRMARLRRSELDPRLTTLLHESATIATSLLVLRTIYDTPLELENPYDIVLEPARARACRKARIAREKVAFRSALARLCDQSETTRVNSEVSYSLQPAEPEPSVHAVSQRYLLHRDGESVPLSHELSSLIDSVVQDLGTVPDDYLTPMSRTAQQDTHELPADAANASANASDLAPVFYYDEWDYLRRHYRKNWCTLRERDTQPGDTAFVAATLAKHSASIGQLKRTFELMRGEDRLLRRQPDGDGIDLDALVDAYGDMRAGTELGTLLFTKRRKHERDLAVMFMVDMSGSTKGWINEAEREALIMLCEALEVLGDRYAIYGFSGMTRKRCETYTIKRFDETYGDLVHARIAGIRPQDYTRMGAAIRHLTTLLNGVPARTRLLIALSDGKPDDYGSEYRGEYGIEDTRHALIEAHRTGIKPFCITIDHEAREYLPHMYGAANWTLVDDVARLPVRVASIYQRLTS